MNEKNILITKLLLIGGAVIILLYIVNNIMKRVGLIKSDATIAKEKKVAEFANSDYFNPNFQEGKTFKKLSDNEIKQVVIRLRKAMRFAGTDESEIYAIFKLLSNKLQISQLSKGYYIEYKADLLTELQNELRESEQAVLMDIINELPNR